jgi:AcrR family transcriptional regulator
MPPPISFSQDVILQEAFEIVRQEGLDALTARKIAQRLQCSTQPVYSAFGSMADLHAAVLQKAKTYAIQYLLQEVQEHSPFLAIGMQYFRFAQAEPQLFKLLFLSPVEAEDSPLRFMPESLLTRMQADPELGGLSAASLKRLFTTMWTFTHGLATLTYASAHPDSEDFARQSLARLGGIAIVWEHLQSRGLSIEEVWLRCTGQPLSESALVMKDES